MAKNKQPETDAVQLAGPSPVHAQHVPTSNVVNDLTVQEWRDVYDAYCKVNVGDDGSYPPSDTFARIAAVLAGLAGVRHG